MRTRGRSLVARTSAAIAIVAVSSACSPDPAGLMPDPTSSSLDTTTAGSVSTSTAGSAPTSTADSPTTDPAPSPTATPSSTVGVSEPAEPTVTHGTITVDGQVRTYRLYVPSVVADGPAPLFIGLHGGTGWGDQFAMNNQIEPLAERNGFIVVHPDGVKLGGGRGGTWNGGVCCGPAARDDVDDVEFIGALIDQLVLEHDIDPGRIFAFGHSNGAIMSYRLACELADRIVGIGVVAGTLGVEGCAPSQPVSISHVHGTADENLPIAGGVGTKSIAGVDFPPPLEGFETLAAGLGCPAPEVTRQGDVTTALRQPCTGGAAAAFVTIETASHPWPGSTTRVPSIVGAPYASYDATTELVAFLLAHPRP